jgi:hypothetical protein
MAGNIVPSYSFQSPDLPAPQAVEYAGAQGVIFTIEPDQLEWIISKIEGWFEDRDEIVLVDHGLSDKREVGTVIMEWEGYEIDPLFLAILRDEELVSDYAVYTRPEGEL